MQTEGLLSLAADMTHAQLSGCAKKIRGKTEYFDRLDDVPSYRHRADRTDKSRNVQLAALWSPFLAN